MAKLTREQVEQYFINQGRSDVDESVYTEFLTAGSRQYIYDEIVKNNYYLPDVDRWFHLMKVMGVEMEWDTFQTINSALFEENIETLELKLPEERGLQKENAFTGDYAEVRQQILDAYRSNDVELAALLAGIGTDLSLADAFVLYADLRQEIDGDKTLYFQSSEEVYNVGSKERLSVDELKGVVADYIPEPEPNEHLRSFLSHIVPFRLLVNNIDVSEKDVSVIVDELIDKGYDTIFDYNQLDGFLLESFHEDIELDRNKLNELKGEIHNLRKELDGTLMVDPGVAPGIEKRLAIRECQLEAAKLGVDIDLEPSDIIDDEHLNCMWYGGTIGSMRYKGYEIFIKVCGDVNFSVLDENGSDVLFTYKNKNNTGVMENDDVFQFIDNDLELETLDNEGRIAWENNNWVEFFVLDPSGNVVTVPGLDTVLEDNVFEAFENVEYYKELIDKIIQKTAEKTPIVDGIEKIFVFDDEIMINDDGESINGYLWAVDALVDRLPSSETMENINFYADYNLRSGKIGLIASYDTPVEDGELNKVLDVALSDSEKTVLVAKFEEYCQKQYSLSCLEFVNEARRMIGPSEPLIEPDCVKPSLDSQVLGADALKKQAVHKADTFAQQER